MNDKGQLEQRRLPATFKVALLAGSEKAVSLHIRRGDDVNAIDDRGMSPLILAASKGYSAICRILLDAGADPLVCDREGNDALAVAEKSKCNEVAELLRVQLRQRVSHVASESSPPDPITMSSLGSEQEVSSAEFLLSLWESYEEPLPPAARGILITQASELQQQISAHVPVDTDEDWTDIDIILPTLRRRSVLGPELLTIVENLLYAGLESGWLMRQQFTDALFDEELAPHSELERIVMFVAEEIGIVVVDDYYREALPEVSRSDAEQEIVASALEYICDLMERYS